MAESKVPSDRSLSTSRRVKNGDKNFSCDATPELMEFIEKTFQPEDLVLDDIRARAAAAGLPDIHLHPMDGLHLEVLTRAMGAKKIVEIGTLAGYSGVRLLRGAGENAHLYTFEIHEPNAEVAKETFRRAHLSTQATVILGSALERLVEVEKFGPFDLVFIDADKNNYPAYLKWASAHLRKGGVVIGDNTFAFGKLGESSEDPNLPASRAVLALREFNQQIAQNGEFLATILPTGEGLTVGVRL